jgi:UDP-N-acetylmuramate dehydrogenase
MKDFYAELAAAGIDFKRDFPLKSLTSFRIGGRADCFAKAGDIDQLRLIIRLCRKYKKEMLTVGSMSNMVVADGRIRKVFVSLTGRFEQMITAGRVNAYCGAGVKNGVLMAFLLKNSLTGAEFLTGIPGSFGGAVFMNAGAFGTAVCAILLKVYAVDRLGRPVTIKVKKEMFGYRKSIFQKNGYVITGAEIKVKRGNRMKIQEQMKNIMASRRSKHPWKEPSCGSFFKNHFPEYTAGRLIEEAGLKGMKVGGAAVSIKHANFLVNKGNATAADVKKLAALVKKEVYKKTGIRLEEEVRYIK